MTEAKTFSESLSIISNVTVDSNFCKTTFILPISTAAVSNKGGRENEFEESKMKNMENEDEMEEKVDRMKNKNGRVGEANKSTRNK